MSNHAPVNTGKAGLIGLILILLLVSVPLLILMFYFPASRDPLMIIPAFMMLAVWSAIVVWVYFDAERRGMSGFLWGILVMFGSIIGLIIYLIIRSGGVPGMVNGSLATCPQCSKPVSGGFKVCPYCGSPLKSSCTACSRPVQADWKICPFCQHRLKD
jgi:RNA polymerase subunit RPABC4/transcription elongation factor Spt4